jgi:hypothetical protein
MRVRIAAALSSVIVLVFILGAPALSVMIGTAVAYGWLVWRGRLEARAAVTTPRHELR